MKVRPNAGVAYSLPSHEALHDVDPFIITFAVPHDGAVETVSIESSMTWNNFRHEIAENQVPQPQLSSQL